MPPLPPPSTYRSSICSVTYGTLGHVDPKQLPQRSKPWAAIAAQGFIHKIDLIAPQESCTVLQQRLVEQLQQPCYARVTMTLGQLLEVDFLTQYIKKGHISMLSEGSATTDNTFSLHRGTLNMYLDRDSFERAGLVGKPYGAKGNRGLKPRWVVSYDLTSPSMVHGKRGFDRLLRASRNVFDKALTWLFCSTDPSSLDHLEKYKPVMYTITPTMVQSPEVPRVTVGVPASTLAQGDRSALEETATELYEWLSLIRLQSPRIAANDGIDPFLSRYRAPPCEAGQVQVCCMLSWQGFMAAKWFRELVIHVLDACSPQQWVSISATGFPGAAPGGTNDLTLLRPSGTGSEYLMWETRTPE